MLKILRNSRMHVALPVVALSTLGIVAHLSPASAHTVTDLGTYSGAGYNGVEIANNGNIATTSINSSQTLGLLHSTSTWLNPLSGDIATVPLALDNLSSPNVVGISQENSTSAIINDPVEWASGSSTPTALSIANFTGASGTTAYPEGINSRGDIVGYSYGVSSGLLLSPGHAFFYRGSTTSWLPVPAITTGDRAYGINPFGQAAGAYYMEESEADPAHPEVTQGVVWTPSVIGGNSFTYTMLGTGIGSNHAHPNPNADPTWAFAINSHGLTVGYSFNTHHAFLWAPTTANGTTSGTTPETLHDLGTLTGATGEKSDAYAISSGAVVGGAATAYIVGVDSTSSSAKAVEWTVTYTIGPANAITINSISSPTDLNTLGTFTGWSLQVATGVNSSNKIVGFGTKSGGTNAFSFL